MSMIPFSKLFLALIRAGLSHQESTDRQIEVLHARIEILKKQIKNK